MSPWLRKDNPFGDSKPEKPIPSTMVRVICEGCSNAIDIRVRKKDNGRKTIYCHTCLQVTEVHVNSMKDIKVFTYRQNDVSSRHQINYEKIWQEGE